MITLLLIFQFLAKVKVAIAFLYRYILELPTFEYGCLIRLNIKKEIRQMQGALMSNHCLISHRWYNVEELSSHRKDSRRELLNKKKLKQLKPESLNLPASVKIYINESLCPYYKKLWTKCKKLWDAKRILSFWVSNGSIRVKLVNENVSIITHDCDLEKLLPGDPLIGDTD